MHYHLRIYFSALIVFCCLIMTPLLTFSMLHFFGFEDWKYNSIISFFALIAIALIVRLYRKTQLITRLQNQAWTFEDKKMDLEFKIIQLKKKNKRLYKMGKRKK